MAQKLETLKKRIVSCRICKEVPFKLPLPHDPRPVVRLSSTAKICIAGQAPGIRVHESGIPFNDPSGDRLRDWMGVDKDTFYDENRIAIVPMGFCFPGYDAKGGDLPPRPECVANWHDEIFASLPQVSLVLVIGQYAQSYHLGKNRRKNLTETVREAPDILTSSTNPRFLALPHPSWRNSAWLKKNPWFQTETIPLLREQIQKLLG